MITGFNTDVDFQGVTYHVQTEDKGLATPLILSLVYNRGTILASKRASYDDLLEKGFDEKVLTERLQKQHKTICAAIRAGRIDDLKQMTAKDSAARRKKSDDDKISGIQKNPFQTEKPTPTEIPKAIEIPTPVENQRNSDAGFKTKIETQIVASIQTVQTPAETQPVQTLSNSANKVSVYKGSESPIPKPKYDFSIKSVPVASAAETVLQKSETQIEQKAPQFAEEELIIEAVEIIEDEMILPAEAVEIVTETVQNKPVDNKLKLEILGDDIFKSGEKKTMSILVHRGSMQNGLSDAQVMVKVLGAAFRPLIFHGKTDAQGIAKVHLQMPLFKQGRAAILIKAMSEGEETELRRTIKHK